jgi:hypothetical protein
MAYLPAFMMARLTTIVACLEPMPRGCRRDR